MQKRLTVILISVFAAVAVLRSSAPAQINLGLSQRASDGTVYEVLSLPNGLLFPGAEAFRVTTVAGSTDGLLSCSSASLSQGAPTSALVGTDDTPGTFPLPLLHPFSAVLRTSLLIPSDFAVAFDASGSGRLTVGTGIGAFDICAEASSCAGGASDAPVLPLDQADSLVPAACIANNVMATCSGPVATRKTFAFGFPSDAEHNCAAAPTTNTTICASVPGDGFTIGQGQLIVFIYNPSPDLGFTIGAGGFAIDNDGANLANCPASSVIGGDAQNPSAPPPPPAATATATATASETLTPTAAATDTETASPTPTPIPSSPTETATIAPTATGTPTPRNTNMPSPQPTQTHRPLPTRRPPH